MGHKSAGLPRPEHPRPDLHRGLRPGHDWLNLNGLWGFEFDPHDTGLASSWAQSDSRPFSGRITVPFPWESHLAWGTEKHAGNDNWFSTRAYLDPESVTRDNYREAPRHTIGWYRRDFQAPNEWRARRVFLNIGAVDWHCRAWVNGIEVGEAVSGYTPLSFDVTDALSWHQDSIVLRVEDPLDHEDQPIGKQVDNWYQRTSGIWQTVWLEPRGEAHVHEVLAHPSLAEAQVRFDIAARGDAAQDLSLHVEVRSSTGTLAGEASGPVGPVHVPMDRPIPWTPHSPHMYRSTVTLMRDGEAVDRVYCSFGLRDVGVCALDGDGPPYISLNGEPVYLRGALDQSFHPAGVYSYPTDASLREDLLLAKRAGFNFLRMHIKPEDPRFYYWADQLGVLLMSDMPNAGYEAWSEELRTNWERCAEAVIRRDFNHPSIISWCLFNETWGLGGHEYAGLPDRHDWVCECYERAKALDPTRLIEDNSPCLYDHVATDINSWHFYINDYEQAREHIEGVVAQTHPGSEFNYVGGNTQGDEPLLNSEYGGISARMGDLDVSWCFRFLTNELRRHEQICGYVYTELQDIEWEHNGVYDYDRSPKEFGYDIALLQGERFVGLDCPPGQTVEPGATVGIPVFLRPSAARWDADSVRWRADFCDGLGRERVLATDAPVGEVIELAMPDEPGLARVQVEALDAAQRVEAANFCYIENVGDPIAEDGAVVLRALAGTGQASFAGEVEAEDHLLSGQGDGRVDYTFELPPGVAPGEVGAATFVAELSSRRPGAPQTGVDKWPSTVTVEVAGVECCRQVLPDQPANSRGALSHMHGFQGRYGELVEVALPVGALSDGRVTVCLSCAAIGNRGGGLAVYGSRAGRYPCDVCLVVNTKTGNADQTG